MAAFGIGPVRAGQYMVSAEDGINPGARAGEGVDRALVVRDGIETRTALVFDRGGSIRGVVLDAAGSPAANVWVNAEQAAGDSPRSALPATALSGASKRVLTDLDGRFALDGIAAGARYSVRALDPHGSAVVQRDVAPTDNLQLRLLAPGSIAGVVVDRAGRPVTNFSLQANNRDTGTGLQSNVADGEGRFALEELAPGPIDLTISTASRETAMRSIELAPGQELAGLSVVLEQDPTLSATAAPEQPPATP